MDGALLLVDKPGEKPFFQMGGLVKRTSAVNVLRGELLVSIFGDDITPRNDGRKPTNYRVKSDAMITLYCDEQDVAPLGSYESLLLEAVSRPSVRFSMFLSGHTLTWGQKLKCNDDVYVVVPGPTLVSTQATPRAAAKVCYVGGLGVPPDVRGGVFFGVEIVEERYRGRGTTDGTFKGTRYFHCEDNCGLFVSLDKLSPDREGSTLSRPPPGGQEHTQSAGSTQVPPRPPQANRKPEPGRPDPGVRGHPMSTRSKLGTDLDAPRQPQFAIGDRVVVHTKKGTPVHGDVRWTDRSTAKRVFEHYVVGIETDVPVRKDNIEGALSGMTHLFTVKTKGCHLFLPEGLVLPEEKPVAAVRKPSPTPRESRDRKAEVGGVTLSQAEVAENQEALNELEKNKLKENARKVLPNESLNLSEQQEEFQRYEEQRAQKREEKFQRYEEQRARIREEEYQRRQEEQRARMREPPQDGARQYADVAGGHIKESHFQRQDHVREQGEHLGVPSVPGLKKAQSLPYPKPPEHPYEDIERCRSGGLKAAIQGSLHHAREPYLSGQPVTPPQLEHPSGSQPTYPQRSDLPPYQDPLQQAYPQASQPRQLQPFPSGDQRYDPSAIPPTIGTGINDPHLYDPSQQAYPQTSRPMQPFPPRQQGYDPLLIPPTEGKGGPQGTMFRGQTDPSGVQSQYAAYTQLPGESRKFHVHLSIGSTVQLSDPPRYGVIRWIGELPAVQGLIAGVELEEPINGASDGTWRQTGEKYFHCEDRKGMFVPLDNLRPDERFVAPGSTPGAAVVENPLEDVEREVQQDMHIDAHPHQIVKYLGERKGIQGHQNSCYLDATVFGLFALSDAFDEVFLKPPKEPSGQEVCRMFWKGIVNPLRMHGVVRFESVMAMRNKLEELGKMKGVNHAEKDPEEFLNMLFKHTLDVEPFISIKRPFGVEKEFFVQLFVEFSERERLPSVGSLLIKMFKEQDISFTQVPSRLLIQVPRYGTKFKTFQKILPALKLDVKDVVDSPHSCFICQKPGWFACSTCAMEFVSEKKDKVTYFCDSCSKMVHHVHGRAGHQVERSNSESGDVSELDLLSVICIETSHYVCFTRSEDQWMFFDSMANRVHDAFNIPKGVDCTKDLNEWVYCENHDKLLRTPPRELPEYVRRFVQDVYMCVYTQQDVGMYA